MAEGTKRVNLVGLGLLVAAVIFLVLGGVVGHGGGSVAMWVIGVVCLVGAVGALFLTYQRRRRAAA